MMKSARMLKEAVQEVEAAAAWYESMRPGLGVEFFAAVDSAIDAIEEGLLPLLPYPSELARLGVSRLLLKRFPYDVILVDEPAARIIIAVAHQSRKPGYWRKRYPE